MISKEPERPWSHLSKWTKLAIVGSLASILSIAIYFFGTSDKPSSANTVDHLKSDRSTIIVGNNNRIEPSTSQIEASEKKKESLYINLLKNSHREAQRLEVGMQTSLAILESHLEQGRKSEFADFVRTHPLDPVSSLDQLLESSDPDIVERFRELRPYIESFRVEVKGANAGIASGNASYKAVVLTCKLYQQNFLADLIDNLQTEIDRMTNNPMDRSGGSTAP